MMRIIGIILAIGALAAPELVAGATVEEFAAASMEEQIRMIEAQPCGLEGQFGDLELLRQYVDHAHAEYAKRPTSSFRELTPLEERHLQAVQNAGYCGRTLESCRFSNRIASVVEPSTLFGYTGCDLAPPGANDEVKAEQKSLIADTLRRLSESSKERDPDLRGVIQYTYGKFLCRWTDDCDFGVQEMYEAVRHEAKQAQATARPFNGEVIVLADLVNTLESRQLAQALYWVDTMSYKLLEWDPQMLIDHKRRRLKTFSKWASEGVEGAAEALAALERGESWIDNPPPLYPDGAVGATEVTTKPVDETVVGVPATDAAVGTTSPIAEVEPIKPEAAKDKPVVTEESNPAQDEVTDEKKVPIAAVVVGVVALLAVVLLLRRKKKES